MRTNSFFLPGDDCDPGYLNIQRLPFVLPAKQYVERLWRTYAPYADRHFREDARRHFHQRYWEMYLAVTLMDAGFSLIKQADEGPEFSIEIEGRRVWVEAIAPDGGQAPTRYWSSRPEKPSTSLQRKSFCATPMHWLKACQVPARHGDGHCFGR
jgi:hypothetical protein